MTTIKVKLRPSAVEGRPGSIVYLVTKNRVSRLITTPYKVFSHEWDEAMATVIQPYDGRLRAIADGIRYDVERLKRIINTFEMKRPNHNVEDIIAEYQRVREWACPVWGYAHSLARLLLPRESFPR